MNKKELISLLNNNTYFDYFSPSNVTAEIQEVEIHRRVVQLVNQTYFPHLYFDLGVVFHKINPDFFDWDNTIIDFYLHMDSSQPEFYLFTKQVMFKETLMGGAGISKQVTYYRKIKQDVSTGTGG